MTFDIINIIAISLRQNSENQWLSKIKVENLTSEIFQFHKRYFTKEFLELGILTPNSGNLKVTVDMTVDMRIDMTVDETNDMTDGYFSTLNCAVHHYRQLVTSHIWNEFRALMPSFPLQIQMPKPSVSNKPSWKAVWQSCRQPAFGGSILIQLISIPGRVNNFFIELVERNFVFLVKSTHVKSNNRKTKSV